MRSVSYTLFYICDFFLIEVFYHRIVFNEVTLDRGGVLGNSSD